MMLKFQCAALGLVLVSAQYNPHLSRWYMDENAGVFGQFSPDANSTSAQATCSGTHSTYNLTTKNSYAGSVGRCAEITKISTSPVKVWYDINALCRKPNTSERTVPKDSDEWDDEYYDGLSPGLKKNCNNDFTIIEIRIWTGQNGNTANAACTTDWNNNRGFSDAQYHYVMYLNMTDWEKYMKSECVPNVEVHCWKGYQIEQSSGAKFSNEVPGYPKVMAMKQDTPWAANIPNFAVQRPTVAPTSSPTPPPTAPTAAPTKFQFSGESSAWSRPWYVVVVALVFSLLQ